MVQPVLNFVRSTPGRILTALLGLGVVGALCAHVDFNKVHDVLLRSAWLFPWILLLEALILGCTMMGLRSLYGEDKERIPKRVLIHAGLVGYAVMGLVPVGRAFAESTRAYILAKYSNGPRAASAAVRLQGAALLAIALISIPASFAMHHVLGWALPTLLIIGNFALTTVLGFGLLFAARKVNSVKGIFKKSESFQNFVTEFDRQTAQEKWIPVPAVLWESLGRVFQVIQNSILILAVGGHPGVLTSLCSEALHLIGAAAGDLIPAQLGATEASYVLSAHALSLQPADAISIAILAHLAQLFWVGVGSAAPLLNIPKWQLKTES
jgi:hypothetical protein